MKKTKLPGEEPPGEEKLFQKAEDTEFWIQVISTLLVMALVVLAAAVGKFAVKQVSRHFDEKAASSEKLEAEIQMDFDADAIITEEELNELKESLDETLAAFTESSSAP